jgi:hypothetical protein
MKQWSIAKSKEESPPLYWGQQTVKQRTSKKKIAVLLINMRKQKKPFQAEFSVHGQRVVRRIAEKTPGAALPPHMAERLCRSDVFKRLWLTAVLLRGFAAAHGGKPPAYRQQLHS